MKSSQVLELFVRTGVGLELFPGESSGYNSSASSVTGDQSPCWGDQAAKRLSIVREESTSSTDRINGTFRPKSRDRRKDKPMAVDVPKIPANYSLKPPSSNAKGPQNTTIIKLSENGTVINNTLIPNMKNGGNHYKSNEILNEEIYSTVDEPSIVESPLSEKIANICFVSKQNETKIVTVEVHRSSSTKIAPPPQFANHQEPPEAPPSITISNADESSSGQSSLSSAINEELRRRAEVSDILLMVIAGGKFVFFFFFCRRRKMPLTLKTNHSRRRCQSMNHQMTYLPKRIQQPEMRWVDKFIIS